MNRRNLIIVLGAIVLAIAWYAFRPELLLINALRVGDHLIERLG